MDIWYENNINNTIYEQFISTEAGFCGDREPSSTLSSSDGLGGTGETRTYYGAYIRLISNKKPKFECTNNSDLYTVATSSKGNQALKYPVGLITADEVAYAGGRAGSDNRGYYLYTYQNYWTMSPNVATNATVFEVDDNGRLANVRVDNIAYGIRPVINLNASITLFGSGTVSNPYRLS